MKRENANAFPFVAIPSLLRTIYCWYYVSYFFLSCCTCLSCLPLLQHHHLCTCEGISKHRGPSRCVWWWRTLPPSMARRRGMTSNQSSTRRFIPNCRSTVTRRPSLGDHRHRIIVVAVGTMPRAPFWISWPSNPSCGPSWKPADGWKFTNWNSNRWGFIITWPFTNPTATTTTTTWRSLRNHSEHSKMGNWFVCRGIMCARLMPFCKIEFSRKLIEQRRENWGKSIDTHVSWFLLKQCMRMKGVTFFTWWVVEIVEVKNNF